MLKLFKISTIITILFINYGAMAAEQSLEALSVWKNQSGSTFTINSINPTTGQLSGVYINNASGYSCAGTPYAATGYAYNNIISWSVLWSNAYENCQSITGWTGYVNSSGAIKTVWELVYNNQISTGNDVFNYVSQVTTKGFKKVN